MAAGSGWNAGAGFANSFLGTLSGLTSLENAQMKNEAMRREMEQEAALDKAWAASQARVGQQDEYGQAIKTEGFTGGQQAKMLSDQGALRGNTPEDQAFERASAEAAAGALRENAVRQGAIPESKAALPTMAPTEYTAKQGMQDYVKAASQISRKGSLEAIQMKSAFRESEIQDQFDNEKTKLNDTLARIHGIGESQGLKGLADAARKEGLKVNFVEGKNGVGSRIQVLGPKGDVLETVSDIGTATDKLSKAAMQQFYDKSVSLLGSPDKVIAAMQGERKIGIEERGVAVKEAIAPSEIAKNFGAASYYQSGGKGAGASDAKNYRQSVVEIPDEKGNKQKVPIISHIVTGKDGVPQIQAYTLDGKPVTDSKIINQLVGAGDAGDTALGADLAAMRKRFEANGYGSYAEYQADVQNAMKNSMLNKVLPPAGASLNPNAGKPNAAPGKALPVPTAGERQMNVVAEKAGWKSYGPGTEMYHRVGPNGESESIKAADLARQLGVEY